MNNFLKYIGVISLLLTLSSSAFGQKYQRILNVGYHGGYAIGGINNFIKNMNFDGITIDGRYFIKDQFSIGLASGWSGFRNQIDRKVYPLQNGEISAVQTRYLRSIPILATAHYYFADEYAKVIPYAGAGVGAYLISYEKWFGALVDAQNKWTVGLRPEAGVMVPLSDKIGINANVRYNFGFYSHNEIDNFSYAEAMLGLIIYWW